MGSSFQTNVDTGVSFTHSTRLTLSGPFGNSSFQVLLIISCRGLVRGFDGMEIQSRLSSRELFLLQDSFNLLIKSILHKCNFKIKQELCGLNTEPLLPGLEGSFEIFSGCNIFIDDQMKSPSCAGIGLNLTYFRVLIHYTR